MRISSRLIVFGLVLLSIFSSQIRAGSDIPVKEIVVDYGSPKSSEQSGLGVEKIFRDPLWSSGLASGAITINRSVDIWMEAIFYRLMDNQLVYDINNITKFSAELRRDIYYATDGQNIIADQFSIGPKFIKQILQIQGIPLNLSADFTTHVLHIYPMSDEKRLSEDLETGVVRRMLNNWFGLLPLLTAILPPSFNANHMYDPVKQLENPFQIPFSAHAVEKMDVGTLSSYSLTSGVYLGLDPANPYASDLTQIIGKQINYSAAFPYSIYKTGEHRINILRRGEDTVWVGVSDVSTLGHSLNFYINTVYLVFSRVVNIWRGVQVPIVPINLAGSREHEDREEQIYSFNLRYKEARQAYEQATSGNFTLAFAFFQAWKNSGKETGVMFEGGAKSTSKQTRWEKDRNFFVQKDSDASQSQDTEVDGTDRDGKFLLLQAKLDLTKENWNILTGTEKFNYAGLYQVKVKKNPAVPGHYVTDNTDKNPSSLLLSMQINEHYNNAEEFNNDVEKIRRFVMMPMPEVPTLPVRNETAIKEFKKTHVLGDPTQEVKWVRVMPTYLGEVRIDAAINLSTSELRKIEQTGDEKILKAIAKVYGFDPNWVNENRIYPRIFKAFDWAHLLAVYAVSYNDSEIPLATAMFEIDAILKSLKEIRSGADIKSKIEGYRDLLTASRPEYIARILLILAGEETAARSVSFGTVVHGARNVDAVKMFESLNKKVFRTIPKETPTDRFHLVQEKFNQFLPTSQRDEGGKPKITKVVIRQGVYDNFLGRPQVIVDLYTNDLEKPEELSAFFRFEQTGEVDVGRFVIDEKVLKLRQSDCKSEPKACYSFDLIEHKDVVENAFLRRLLSYDRNLQLSLAISYHGKVWSERKTVSFRLKEGLLYRATR